MNEFMKVINHGENQIDLTHIGTEVVQARPTELHFKTNGSIDDKPSFVIVMRYATGAAVYGQFTLDTLEDCLEQLGYEINS